MPEQLDYASISEIFRRFHAADPAPVGELVHHSAFTLLVAVALSVGLGWFAGWVAGRR